MVEPKGAGGDSSGVLTIAELLARYRDLTGASYDAMSDQVGGAITGARFHELAKKPIKAFPRAATIQHLADLLHLPVTTVVLSFAASLGVPVQTSESALSLSLPPGTDTLTERDREAILAVVRALVDARRHALPREQPEVEGIRLDETNPNLRVIQPTNGPAKD